MSTVIGRVKRAVTRPDGAGVVRECRQCGTTVTQDMDTCPECDSAEIAEYRLS